MAFAGSTTGTVKWFNNEKKFGKVESDEGEIFLPPDVAKDFAEELVEGATVSFSYITGEKGKAASQITGVTPPVLDEKEFTGRVKWYDPERGMGYITPKGLSYDVRVSADVVKNSDYSTLATGQNVTITAEGLGERWDATSIVAADSLAVLPGWHIGNIIRTNREKTIGFLTSPEGATVMLHISVAKVVGLTEVFKGLELAYQYDLDQKSGLRVTGVCDPDDLPAAAEADAEEVDSESAPATAEVDDESTPATVEADPESVLAE